MDIYHQQHPVSAPVITFIFLLLANCSFSQPEVSHNIDKYLQYAVPFGFSGQVVIEKDDRILLNKAYGVTDRLHREPMTRETLTGIASVSKQFCAAAVLTLVDNKKISLDDTLSEFFPDIPKEKAGITIHQLLTHTSGLRRSKNDDFEIGTKNEMLKDIFQTPLAFEPGSNWRYSVGYSIAAVIIEKVSGQSYPSYLSEHLFKPANLEHTVHIFEDLPNEIPVTHSYVGWRDNGTPADWAKNFRNFGGGDIYSTAGDLQRWIEALESGKILSDESIKKFWSPQSRIKDRPVYAYGWFMHEAPGDTVIEHGGDAALGHNGGIFIHKNKNLKIFIISNGRTADGRYSRHAVTRDIEQMVLEKEGEILSRPPAEMIGHTLRQSLAGTYAVGKSGIFHLISDGSYLWVAAEGQEAVNLLLQPGEKQKKGFPVANRKTFELLDGLQHQRKDAFEQALTGDHLDHLESYQKEWNRLVSTLGPLQRITVRGSSSFFDNAETIARLHFRDTAMEMAFVWTDVGHGRLRATATFNRLEYPAAYPVAMENDRTLIVNGLFDEVMVKIHINQSGPQPDLHITKINRRDTTIAMRRIGLAGWENNR